MPEKLGQDSYNTFLLGLGYQIFNTAMMAAAPAPAPAKTYLEFFDWDKYSLIPRATQIIMQAAADSKTTQTMTLDVSGYPIAKYHPV